MLNMPWFIWLNVILLLVVWAMFWLARKFSQPPHILSKILNRFMFIMALALLVLNWNPTWLQSIQPAITPLLYLFLLVVAWETISTFLEAIGILKTDEDIKDKEPENGFLNYGCIKKESTDDKLYVEESAVEEKSTLIEGDKLDRAIDYKEIPQSNDLDACPDQESRFDVLTDLDDNATYTPADSHTQPIKDPLQAEKEFTSSIKTLFSPQSTDSERLQQVSKLLTNEDNQDDLDKDEDDSKLVEWVVLSIFCITLGTPFYVALKYTLL
jgi:hypothetical protein